MKGILLDTHIWLWYVLGSEELDKKIRKIITNALQKQEAHLAAISLWEISMLNKKERIILEMPCLEWLNKSIELTRINILALSPAIAAESCTLPGKFHADPADCIIAATARVEELTLVTRDKQIMAYSRNKFISVIKA